jgi:predicted nucleic acid-binding protein
MRPPVFVDSNIWLYAFLKQEEKKRKKAKKLIKSIKNDSLWISTQVINEVCFNLRKNNFPESEIKEIVSSFYNDYRVVYFKKEIMINASAFRERYSLSFWDSLVIASALFVSCETLCSEDMHHNQIIESKLRIINPFK